MVRRDSGFRAVSRTCVYSSGDCHVTHGDDGYNGNTSVSYSHVFLASVSSTATASLSAVRPDQRRPWKQTVQRDRLQMRAFTVRSPTLITRRQAICHTPTLTEPRRRDTAMRYADTATKNVDSPFGANGSASHQVSGPSQPGGR